jgi:hypothetical protein
MQALDGGGFARDQARPRRRLGVRVERHGDPGHRRPLADQFDVAVQAEAENGVGGQYLLPGRMVFQRTKVAAFQKRPHRRKPRDPPGRRGQRLDWLAECGLHLAETRPVAVFSPLARLASSFLASGTPSTYSALSQSRFAAMPEVLLTPCGTR